MTADPDQQRRLAAFHEAGHAVAAVMRGGASLTSVSLDPEQHGAGITWSRAAVWDQPFLIWAGPWAEARHRWGDRAHDDVDDDGCIFEDYVIGAMLSQPAGDAEDYRQAVDDHVAHFGGLISAEQLQSPEQEIWPREMERVWPAVKRVAGLLLDGRLVDDALVRAAVETDC